MGNNFFIFRQFTVRQEKAAFKVGTDSVLLGACADIAGCREILDVGTGTGLLAIMMAQRSEADITAIEPDKLSFDQAGENVNACKWADRINVVNSDLLSFSPGNPNRFDMIIMNPPYFRNSLLNPDMAKSSARHTFSLSSEDILEGASGLLKRDGSLQLILPYEEGTIFTAEAGIHGFYCNIFIKVKPNPTGKIIRMIMKFERIKKPVYEKFLTIETGTRHRYTEEYKEVTGEFYLNV
jgi:tRNA1Val (adenine37-N6)-methyltransferase